MAGRLLSIACISLTGCFYTPPIVDLLESRLNDRLGRDGWALTDWQRVRSGYIAIRVEIPASEAQAALSSQVKTNEVMTKAYQLCPTKSRFVAFDGDRNQWAGLGNFSVDITAPDGARISSFDCIISSD